MLLSYPALQNLGEYLLQVKSQAMLSSFRVKIPIFLKKNSKNPQKNHKKTPTTNIKTKTKQKTPPQNTKKTCLSLFFCCCRFLLPTSKFHSLVSYTIYSVSFPPQKTKANLNSIQFQVFRASQCLHSGPQHHPDWRGAQELSVQPPAHSRLSCELRSAPSGLYPGRS